MTATPENQGILRFITAGSVDDGKSTLIGRLLYDSKGIFADQLSAISKSRFKRTAGDAIDLALLTDGLEAEREQGITIDIAYRYFSTPKRKFIIADAPGHEQYTRNMVTGASTADAAIILIDATRVVGGELLAQTKRHSVIAKLLGIANIIVAVNKMDLVDFSEAHFNMIQTAYARLATELGLQNVHYIPVSALNGDNVVEATESMSWYGGEPLLTLLEGLSVSTQQEAAPFRFPVQIVARQDGSSADDFRGYMGRVESGSVAVGDTITVQPARISATVAEILGPNGNLDVAHAGQSVTIRLGEDVDVSRGDVLAKGEVTVSNKFIADLCWFDEDALTIGRKYLLKTGTAIIPAKVQSVTDVLDIHTLALHNTAQEQSSRTDVKMNDIAIVSVLAQKPIVCEPYAVNHATGAFVLIDEVSHQTVAAGMILQS
ncbi:sulfate adenylyltransferase subunit 1 [Ampullimonas aquatilis]|uniref:sulfate adenylyltransferase subunit 1 n=1 Tax=Ampullimonas aquatilis TaxID=1341549 RepID=UPI003C70F27B